MKTRVRTFREVLVHDIETLLVDLQVFVVLQVVDGDHTSSFLDVDGILVDGTGTGHLLVHLTDLQDVLQTVEGDLVISFSAGFLEDKPDLPE